MTMKFVITSEQRVGSRWIGYLLGSYLTQTKPMPEINLNTTDNVVDYVNQFVKANRIVKVHNNPPEEVVRILGGEFKILGIVRNPRDRLVSLSFHKRYHPFHDGFAEKKVDTDEEALVKTVLENEADRKNNYKMLEYMLPMKSTKFLKGEPSYYVWTTYEWLKADVKTELKRILNSLGLIYHESRLDFWIKQYEFKHMTGRKPGQEDRENTFARKGVVDDWKNCFTEEMIDVTQDAYDKYYERIEDELGSSV